VQVDDPRTPLPLVPKLTAAIWGGNALVKRYGKPGDPHARLGESWECWDENAVAAGPFVGATVAQLRERLGPVLLGPLDAHRRFPVLTKIIDAAEPLSVQVHPDDVYAQRVEGEPFGKTECWYILAAREGAELVLGWSRDTSRAEYTRKVADGTLGDLLRRVRVRAGDVFYLPAGTLHAIGAGIQLFETQQASDLTYRIFDWNRLGADGKPRALHVDKAADVLEFHATMPGAIEQLTVPVSLGTRTLCVVEPRFALERVELAPGPVSLATGGRPLAVTAGDGPLAAATAGGVLALGPWQTALVPAAAEWVELRAAAPASAFVAYAEPDPARFRAEAQAAGISPAVSAAFFRQFL
jgi:mannose-6-phosphate isomerase